MYVHAPWLCQQHLPTLICTCMHIRTCMYTHKTTGLNQGEQKQLSGQQSVGQYHGLTTMKYIGKGKDNLMLCA